MKLLTRQHNFKINTYTLEDVSVLVQPFLGKMRLLQLNTELQVHEHDGLQHLLAAVVAHLTTPDDLIEDIQRTTGFANIQELCPTNKMLLKC